jgi:hypothetical protein
MWNTILNGLKSWKTLSPAVVSAFFGFVLAKPQYFAPIIQDIAAYACAGGLIVFGIYAKDVANTKGGTTP